MYYSYAEMRPYLGTNIRIKKVTITVALVITYNSEHIAEMESIAYLWRDSKAEIMNVEEYGEENRIVAEDLQLVLNSPIILQCRELLMDNAHFSFKDYKVLYAVKVIETCYYSEYEIDLWQQYWQQFLEQPDVKPIVVFRSLNRDNLDNLLDRLSKAFSTAVLPNAFKIIFAETDEELTEFRETNNASGEILELKKGFPVEYQNEHLNESGNYTLERSSV
ncbi:hypothetical protein Ddc_11105 [Ditylenchus destructor]|nr:hypothetical protein Ddc_11105 [Ditylenchus destructor]